MTKKRFIKLTMGKGCSRNYAEKRARLVISPCGQGSYQKQWEFDLATEEIFRLIFEGMKKKFEEIGIDLERIC